MRKQRIRASTTHIILLSFLIAILIGALLLSLPISSADGKAKPFLDALFTATTSTCVTGLVVTPTVSSWSIFGQAVILILIQIGGLGVITIMSGLMILLHKKIGIGDRLLLQDAFNLNSLSGLVRFVKKVVGGTFIIEGIGALLYMIVFIPQFGAKGVHLTTLDGIIAKDNPEIYDYDIPQSLRDIYKNKDYGRWAIGKNGRQSVPVCFLASNHTTGGNSGSPVLNGKGELVGINFDRTWRSTMSDIEFDPAICRNISVDIRYVLFVVDRIGGAGYLLEEMGIK